MDRQTLRRALILGLLTAVGPFGTDMYLPVLPELGRSLGADSAAAQATLAGYFVSLGAAQLVAGPLSDMFGRKRPIYFGLALFVLASIGCAFAPTVEALIAFRLLQGLGACTSMVTPRAIVRDMATGPEAGRLMGLLLTIYSVSPILAPAFGSATASQFGWRGVFSALAAVGVIAILGVRVLLPETRPPDQRQAAGIRTALANYRELLADGHFLRMALTASFSLGGFFVYVAHSSFVMRAHFAVEPGTYAVLFALNAVGFVAVSQANGWVGRRLGLAGAVSLATRVQAGAAIALLALTLLGVDQLWLLVTLPMVVFSCNGILVPSLFVLAMDRHPSRAGSASALIGTLNFAGGAAVIAVASPFSNGSPAPMVAGVATCTVLAFVLATVELRSKSKVAHA